MVWRAWRVLLAEELEQMSIGGNRVALDGAARCRLQPFLVCGTDRVGKAREGLPEGTLFCRSILLALHYFDDARQDHSRQRETIRHPLAQVPVLLLEVRRNRVQSCDVVLVVMRTVHPDADGHAHDVDVKAFIAGKWNTPWFEGRERDAMLRDEFEQVVVDLVLVTERGARDRPKALLIPAILLEAPCAKSAGVTGGQAVVVVVNVRSSREQWVIDAAACSTRPAEQLMQSLARVGICISCRLRLRSTANQQRQKRRAPAKRPRITDVHSAFQIVVRERSL